MLSRILCVSNGKASRLCANGSEFVDLMVWRKLYCKFDKYIDLATGGKLQLMKVRYSGDVDVATCLHPMME